MRRCFLLFAVMLNSVWAFAQYSGSGNGTEDDPYLIYNETQLYQMSNFLNQSGVVFKLMKDIDLTDFISENFPTEGWTPIGVSTSHFMGVFYGNNHTISGLTINKNVDYVGFFGYLDCATVKDFTLKGSSIKGGSYTGTLCGYAANSTISNCCVELTSTFTGGKYSGGFVGYITSTPISKGSFMATSVSASSGSGGFVGYVDSSTISNCSCQATYFYSSASTCGGFTGKAVSATFTECSTTGDISSGSGEIGGFCGEIQSTTISNSTAIGNVTGSSNIGGFIGYALSTCSASSCRSFGNISGSSNVSGFAGCLDLYSSVTFTSCHSKGTITNTGDYTGGIVGISNGACIAGMTGCSHFGDINAQNYVGGLVGKIEKKVPNPPTLHKYTWSYSSSSEYTNYSNSYHYSTVTETIDNSQIPKVVKNCTAIGNIVGKTYVGGLIGEDLPSYSYQKASHTFKATYSNVSWYLWEDGSYTGTRGYYTTYYTYTRNCSSLSISDSYYSGSLSGTEFVGGIVGNKTAGDVTNCYVYTSDITGTKNVGGVAGYIGGDITTYSDVSLKSNVAINTVISATESNVGRIYGSNSTCYVNIGALASSEGNKALTTTRVIKQGIVQSITDDLQNGNVMGKSLLKLKANYVAMGWNFDNDWDILETESFPYKKFQAAPPVIESNLTSQDTEISGYSTNGGTVYLYYKDKAAVSTNCDGNAWRFTTEALQSGATVQLYADVTGMTPSYLSTSNVKYPGSGTEDDPYRIYTAEDLQGASNKGYYKLMNDVDLTSWINENSPSTGWVSIGRDSGEATYINGDGHKVTGLWINTTQDNTGLFSNFSAGTIKNLTVEVATGKKVKGGDYTGILIGRNANGEIINCNVAGDVEGTVNVGGVVGHVESTTLTNNTYEGSVNATGDIPCAAGISGKAINSTFVSCKSTAKVSTSGKNSDVGGLVGASLQGTITKCSSNSTITATGSQTCAGSLVGFGTTPINLCWSSGSVSATGEECYSGGLTGYLSSSSVKDCYSCADVTGTYYVGGLVGYSNQASIDRSYAKGNVYGETYGGGVVAELDGSSASITNCIAANTKLELSAQSAWGCRVLGGFKNSCPEPDNSNYALSTMQVSLNGVPQKKTDDPVEGVAKTEAELMSSETYINLGWDFSSAWAIEENQAYPYLLWEVEVQPVTDITLSNTTLIIAQDNTVTITANVMPLGATNKHLQWSTSKSSVATVADGVVTAVGIGTAVITAKAADGSNVSATCEVTVVANHDAAIAELQALIDNAQKLYDDSSEGSNIGQYQKGARAALLTVIKSVSSQISSTMDDATIESCTKDINDAITAFKLKQVTAGSDTDISEYDNVVYINNVETRAGSQATLSVQMDNAESVYGYEFKLYLPDGITVATETDTYGDTNPCVTLNTTRTSVTRHTFESSLSEDGVLTVLCYSTKKYAFANNSGEVAQIVVNVADGVEAGDYPIIIRAEAISLDATTPEIDYIKSTLTVSDFKAGDANGDGKINVGDITAIAGYILGSAPSNFVEKGADANEDGKVNVGDITTIAGMILNGTANNIKSKSAANESSIELVVNDMDAISNEIIVPVSVNNSVEAFSSFQFDMNVPDGFTMKSVATNNARLSLDYLCSAKMENGTYRILGYNLLNHAVCDTHGAILYVTLEVDGNLIPGSHQINFDNAVFSKGSATREISAAAMNVNVADATGIMDVVSDRMVDVYDTNGRILRTGVKATKAINGLAKGVYIVNGTKIIK